MTRVTYKDAVSAQNDLAEGRIQLYSAAYAIIRGQIQAGRIRALAVQNRTRAPGIDLPTVAEAGLPELQLDGLVGPGRALERPRQRCNRAHRRGRENAPVRPGAERAHTATGQIVNPGSPAELAAAIDEQSKSLAAWSK